MSHAILLVNMGGPARRQDVQPYLRSIFRDPAIIALPRVLRAPLAGLIALRRAPAVAERYELIGGYSPLFHWSGNLRLAVKAAAEASGLSCDVAYAFRYISPTIPESLAKLKHKGARRVQVVPLFPHYTHTMTGSVMKEVWSAAKSLGLDISYVQDWGLEADVLALWSRYLHEALAAAGPGARVMFVAHGIPQIYVKRGDDYPDRVHASAVALARTLPPETEWTVAYQSKVGPLPWTRPYMEDELQRWGTSRAPMVMMPLSFVADCLETLYDLDLVAGQTVAACGVNSYVRARVFNDDADFARIALRLSGVLEHAACA